MSNAEKTRSRNVLLAARRDWTAGPALNCLQISWLTGSFVERNSLWTQPTAKYKYLQRYRNRYRSQFSRSHENYMKTAPTKNSAEGLDPHDRRVDKTGHPSRERGVGRVGLPEDLECRGNGALRLRLVGLSVRANHLSVRGVDALRGLPTVNLFAVDPVPCREFRSDGVSPRVLRRV